MNNLENKIQIYRMRITTLVDEHADALAQAQALHKELQDAKSTISELEEKLRNNNVQKEDAGAVIITKSVDASKD